MGQLNYTTQQVDESVAIVQEIKSLSGLIEADGNGHFMGRESPANQAGALFDVKYGNTIALTADRGNSAPLKSVAMSGSTSQDGSPSISTPKDVSPLRGYDGKMVFNGTMSEIWSPYTSPQSGRTSFYFSTDAVSALTSRYSYQEDGFHSTESKNIFCMAGGKMYFTPKDTAITTVEKWRNYLAEKPLTVWISSETHNVDSAQYYALGVDTESEYFGVGTMEKIDPLYAGDKIDFLTGRITRHSFRHEFDGTEWIELRPEHFIYLYYNIPYAESQYPQSGCASHYPYGRGTGENHCYGGVNAKSGRYISFRIVGLYEQNASGIDQFKTWLAAQKESGTPVVVSYRLSEEEQPIIEHVALSEDITLLRGALMFSCGGTLEVSYARELADAYNELKTAIIALGGSI